MNQIERDIINIEKEIRSGDSKNAQLFVKNISYNNLDPIYRVKILEITRRLGLVELGISRFNRCIIKIYESHQILEQERLEYAVCLMKSGCFWESYEILNDSDEKVNPIKNLYLAYWYILNWDYNKAEKYLNIFIENSTSEYLTSTAYINLLASYIYTGKYNNAYKLSDELIYTFNPQWKLLLANLYTLRTELGYFSKNISLSKKSANLALKLLKGEKLRSMILAEKWNLIINLYLNPSKNKNSKLIEFGKSCSNKGLWEVHRDCDFHSAYLLKNQMLIEKLYFGTSFSGFRKRVKALSCNSLNQVNNFLWQPKAKCTNEMPIEKKDYLVLDVQSGVYFKTGQTLKYNSLSHRLLKSLSKDFYRPVSCRQLFFDLYGTSPFLKPSSYKRVQRIIERLREWFEEVNIPCEIVSENNKYSIKSSSDHMFLRVSSKVEIVKEEFLMARRLEKLFEDQNFTINEVIATFSCSDYQARKTINWAISNEIIFKHGSGKNTKYGFRNR